MKIIVIYTSKTGFAKMYAQWVSETLHCEMIPLKNIKDRNLEDYDVIVYGAGLMAGKMYCLDKLKQHVSSNQKLYIFATGAIHAQATDVISKIEEDNLKIIERNVPFYYYQAGLCYEKMGFFSKKLLKMMYHSLKKKKDKTHEEMEMMKALGCSHIDANQEDILNLISHIKQGL